VLRGLVGSPGASEELQKNVQKGGLLGDSRAEINAQMLSWRKAVSGLTQSTSVAV